jgi:hypothetical protein
VCVVTDEQSQAPCAFLYLQEFGVTSVYPTAGSTAGGLVVSVVGFGMLDEATAMCRFGTATSKLSVTSSTTATCETPAQGAGAIGLVDFAVSINGADYRSLGPASFEVYLRPLITSVSPDGAPISGGTKVSILGEGFTKRANRLVLCRFGSVPIRSIESTATKVVCTTPAVPFPSPLPLVVTVVGIGNDLDGYSAIEWSNSTTFNYTFYAQPSITYIAPWAGYSSGDEDGQHSRFSSLILPQTEHPAQTLAEAFRKCRFFPPVGANRVGSAISPEHQTLPKRNLRHAS